MRIIIESKKKEGIDRMSTENTHLSPNEIHDALSSGGGVYFIGIGGVMMSSLALLTKRMGFEVRGSDRTRTETTEKLEREGITVYYGHDAQNVRDFNECSLTVYTVAISPDNPEYKASKERGILAVSRANYLGYIMTFYKNRVGVAGMHGKSTCTSMCAQIFMGADVDPTILSGADYAPMGGAYRIGKKDREHFIFEACEYMDSFLDFYPTVAVLLNAEMEHVDYFKSMEQIRESFRKFAAITGSDVQSGGTVVVNMDDCDVLESANQALADGDCKKIISFSLIDPSADLYAANISVSSTGCCEFDLMAWGKHISRVALRVTGRHQIYNSLASAGAAYACGIPWEDIIKGLEAFSGAGRRMEYRGILNGAAVYDDYGHHPTEIAATLSGAKCLCREKGRLICAFQPHTYSRTAELFEKFKLAFDDADLIILLDIYSAREDNTYGVSSQKLADAICATGKNAIYAPSYDIAADIISDSAKSGDTVVIMGAGDIYHLSRALIK